ncbi:MAG: MogA/MoaB family molybdenum cofactor biosynthesis protein [Thermovirgaceae bacterium]|nr:MogA/MoaB family molybdenum cofactor biosynthesis protein [Thermovirgaceae bacterium]
MKKRVLGFSGLEPEYPVVFIHENSEKIPLVNGKRFEIHLQGPGGRANEGNFLIRVSDFDTMYPGDFVSFSGGVILQSATDHTEPLRMMVSSRGFLSVSSTFEIWQRLQAGILTVSDKGSHGERVDTSGPALEAAANAIGASTSQRSIVPDEISAIKEVLNEWIFQKKLDLILVTGGTGLSSRDVTPEAIRTLGGKEVPGIGEYMRWKTSFENERSILSRSLAVAFGNTLVISLPGSERGSVQCFNSVAPVLRHALEILSGRGADCGKPH